MVPELEEPLELVSGKLISFRSMGRLMGWDWA
jgi:hypothetical protein